MKSVPMLMIVGKRDFYANKVDFARLEKLLPPERLEKRFINDFGHLDYLWGVRAKEEVYDVVLEFLIKTDVYQ